MKKVFKKLAILTMILVMAFGMVACSNSKTEEFVGTQAGFGGDVVVTLAVKDEKIESVSVVGAEETANIGGVVVTDANEEMQALVGKTLTEAADFTVDTVSGATVTSVAIQGAFKNALRAANGGSATKTPVEDATAVFDAPGNSVETPVSVEITLADNQITDIKIVESTETDSHGGGTSHIAQTVVDLLIPRIIESQSLAVDSISGATNTSNAVKSAVAQAIDAAGGDSSEWYTAVEKKTDVVKLEGYDVIVVGLGGSGTTAYISAAENGATVFGIEATGKIGGQSATVSGPMAINPSIKMEEENNGEKFLEEEELIADWTEYTLGDAKEEMVRWFVENSGETMDWLMTEYDFEFGGISAFFHPKMWKVWATYTGDKTDYFTNAVDKAVAMNEKNDYLLELTADSLLMDGDTVVGVKATYHDGTVYEIYGDSVILATGGFISNAEMMEEYIGDVFNADTIGTEKGTGIQMGLDVGAATYNIDMPVMMHIAQIKNIIKTDDLTADQKTVLTSLALASDNMKVGTDGTRYMSEAGNIAFDNWMGGAEFYSIYSQAQIDSYKSNGLDQVATTMFLAQGGVVEAGVPVTDLDTILTVGEQYGNVIFADTLDELAEKMGVDASVLKEEVANYSSYANGEATDPFGKDTALMTSLEEGPYVAVVGAGYAYGTCGGLDVDENMNVLKTDGTPIGNLYAVGQDSMGVLFSNQVPYVTYGGAAQGWVLTSGYQAGLQAAINFAE